MKKLNLIKPNWILLFISTLIFPHSSFAYSLDDALAGCTSPNITKDDKGKYTVTRGGEFIDNAIVSCLCDSLKAANSADKDHTQGKAIAKDHGASQLASYCAAFTEESTTFQFEQGLVGVDSLAALSCFSACVAPTPLSVGACNCVGLVSSAMEFADQVKLAALTAQFETQGVMSDAALAFGGIGVLSSAPGCVR